MSAQILRNLVASVFNIKATSVILSGEIAPDKSWQNSYKDGSCGSDEQNYKIWGFNPQKGFVELTECVGYRSSSNYAHSNSYDKEGKQLAEITNVEDYIFFLVNSNGYTAWSGSEHYDWNTWTLYKAPNFQSYWTAVEAADVQRWESWLPFKKLSEEELDALSEGKASNDLLKILGKFNS